MLDKQQIGLRNLSEVNGESYFEEVLSAELVPISNIHFDKTYQARSNLNDKQVNSYSGSMKNGAKFPPVRLARIDGKQSLTIIDGWHRLKAVMLLNVGVVPAIVETMSAKDALRIASLANLGHGLPIKSSEVRNVFRMFVKSGGCRKGNTHLSYRDLSKVLNGRVAHSTIANWMKQDFPRIAKAMGFIEHGNSQADTPRINFQDSYIRQAQDAIEQTLVNFREVSCPTNRFELHELALRVVSEMNKYEMEKPDF